VNTQRVVELALSMFAGVSVLAWGRRPVPHRGACVCGHLFEEHAGTAVHPFDRPCSGTIVEWSNVLLPDPRPQSACLCPSFLARSASRFRYPKG
jgi:hypothetical protein